jgi:hypothetical protein
VTRYKPDAWASGELSFQKNNPAPFVHLLFVSMIGIINTLRSWLARRIFRRWPKHKKTEFIITEAFPPSDPLAIDILRFLASYNDLSAINEWARELSGDKKNLSTLAHISLIVSKTDLHLRLLGSILHEALRAIEEFERLHSSDRILCKLDLEAKTAFDRLLKIAKGQDPASKSILKLVRNEISYHYDRKTFEAGLRVHTTKDNYSYVLLLDEEVPMRGFYFPLADDLRTHILDEHKNNQGIPLHLSVTLEIQHLYKIFLESTLLIYARDKGISFGLNRGPLK